MGIASIGLLLFVALGVGLPVAFSLNLIGLVGFASLFGYAGFKFVPSIIYDSMHSFILTAVPLFIILGKFLSDGGIGKRLFEFGQVWLRHVPGGVAVATILSCGIMAAVAGSSTAIVAAIGMFAIPELIDRGYSKSTATGVVAAGATLGILIPPSIPLLIYSAVTDESAGKLFLAGVVPGIILMLSMCAYVAIQAEVSGVKRLPRASWAERLRATREALWALLLPVIVLGSIYTGVVTPTEAAAVGVAAAVIITVFIYRTVTPRKCLDVLLSGASTSVMILSIVQGAMVFGKFATLIQAPQQVVDWITALDLSAIQFVIVANVLFIVLGCFLEVISIILIVLPGILVTMHALNIDLVWFAIIMMVNMELALITPPVGINLYVVAGMTKGARLQVSQLDIVRGVIPYFWIMIGYIVLLMLVPALVTYVPSMFYK